MANSYKPYNIIKPYSTTRNNSESKAEKFGANAVKGVATGGSLGNASSIINGADGADGGSILGGLLGNAGIINGAAGAIAGAAAGALGGTQGNPTNNTNQYDALYTGNSFKDWYKTHYGSNYTGQNYSRPEEMNDLDWDIGRALYDA